MNSTSPILFAVNITKSFSTPVGKIDVLKDINLTIQKGESVSIRGESGSGKTTLLQILGGLDSPDTGELFWQDIKINNKSNHFLAKVRTKSIGYIFQFFHLIPELTALENVILAAKIAGKSKSIAKKEALELLEKVGLHDRINHLPIKLSGGECQRVAIARSLINHPPLILADEPTGNLDEKTGEHIMSLLLEICKIEKTALLIVTHNIEYAKRTDRELLLQHGVLKNIE